MVVYAFNYNYKPEERYSEWVVEFFIPILLFFELYPSKCKF